MRLAYFDASAGVSGDMMLGAIVDAGLGLAGLRAELSGLDLDGYELSAEETKRCGLRATQVRVALTGDHVHARKVRDIFVLIERSRLRPAVKERARSVFERLAEAEARAHGAAIEDIHLHEVGAVDALVDVVGTVAGLAALGVERVVFSPLRIGFGAVHCAHGVLPVPAPAVAELIKHVPVYAGEIEGEMVTPTGAALAVTLAETFGPMPPLRPAAVGIGAGAADRAIPNVLRLFLGEEMSAAECADLVMLETNIDDMNPEFFAHVCARLKDAGALDVWLTPIQMKKGRPGTLLSVLATDAALEPLRAILFTESTTLGIREHRVRRHALRRENMTVDVAGTPIAVKVGWMGGQAVQAAPEYEDCRKLAQRIGLPLKDVYQSAQEAAWRALRAGSSVVKEE